MRLLIYVGLVVLAVGSVMACSFTPPASPVIIPKTQPPAATENEQPAEMPPAEVSTENAAWIHVKSFAGKDSENTAAFTISGTKWRIIWAAEAQNPELAVLNILVSPKDMPNVITETISYSKDVPGGTVYIDEGGRDYYLKIIAANLKNWNITVEDYVVNVSSEPVQIVNIYYKGMDWDNTIATNHLILEWDEYVEIKNTSFSPQNISGWTLKNITKGQPTYVFPIFAPCSCKYWGTWQKCVDNCYPQRPCIIEPRESIRVHTGAPHWESGGYCFYYEPGDAWDNVTPDTAVLYDSEGREVSRRSYTIPPKNTDTSTDSATNQAAD